MDDFDTYLDIYFHSEILTHIFKVKFLMIIIMLMFGQIFDAYNKGSLFVAKTKSFCFCLTSYDHLCSLITLQSKGTVTSKTFMVPKVFILRNLHRLCLKAHYLPFIHAKFHSSGLSGLASTWIWVKMWFTPREISENIDKLTALALNQCYFVINQSKMTRLVLKVRY